MTEIIWLPLKTVTYYQTLVFIIFGIVMEVSYCWYHTM